MKKIDRVKKRFVEGGLDVALNGHRGKRSTSRSVKRGQPRRPPLSHALEIGMRVLSIIYKRILNSKKGYEQIRKFVRKQGATVVFYRDATERAAFDLVQKIRTQTNLVMNDVEAIQLYRCALNTKKIPGDIAEVGTFMGASAKILCEAESVRNIHLFDTFRGLPETSEVDSKYSIGDYTGSYEFVQKLLKPYKNVSIYKGFFPKSGELVKDKQFSLVNLDVDIYESTLSSLQFFYPRMSQGGIIISHDYNFAEGVKKAFDEFFADKPEPLIELTSTQVMITKI